MDGKDLLFNDAVKLIPKCWLAKEHIAHLNVISCAYLEALDTASCVSASSLSTANFTEPATYEQAITAYDNLQWKDACDAKIGALEAPEMKCWVAGDESTMPPDAELTDSKWVLQLKYEHGK